MKSRTWIIRDRTLCQRVMEEIGSLDPEKPWEVTIKPYVRKRSLQANNLYWKWLTVIHEDTGQDKDDLHELMMRKFLEPRFVMDTETGEAIEIYSTRKLNTAEFRSYLDKIEAEAATFGISLPHPEDMHRHD